MIVVGYRYTLILFLSETRLLGAYSNTNNVLRTSVVHSQIILKIIEMMNKSSVAQNMFDHCHHVIFYIKLVRPMNNIREFGCRESIEKKKRADDSSWSIAFFSKLFSLVKGH